jgi:beta-glucanase (GH16 family)
MHNRIIALLLLALAAGSLTLQAAPPPGYTLVWSDEFNGAALDTNVWHYRTGARLLSFQKPENVTVTNGLLRLALKKEPAGKLNYTAGGVISKREFTYGFYEARFRCPRGAGWHTAFWTMHYQDAGARAGADFAQLVEQGKAGGAVRAQEIDICEQDAVNTRSYSAGVIDWSGRGGKKSVNFGRQYFYVLHDEVPDFAADFHVWACEFTPQVVKFFLDGKLTHQTDATKFPHGPQSVWLTCVGALWGKPKPPQAMDDSAMPAFADFDWVRVYELAK